MTTIVLDETPGLPEVVEIVQALGGVLLHPDAAIQLAVAAWCTAERALKAEALADAADQLTAFADVPGFSGARQAGLRNAALFLDVTSYEMRNP